MNIIFSPRVTGRAGALPSDGTVQRSYTLSFTPQKAMVLPSSDQTGESAETFLSVSDLGGPTRLPSFTGATLSCPKPLSSATKAINDPSGDHAGSADRINKLQLYPSL